VFLTHAPPEGIHDLADPCHRGFHCFRTFLDRFKPALHVHGHIHRYGSDSPRATPCGSTTVINAYDHYTLDFIPPDSKKGIAHE
jgi:Icc-related predicted phosphoesterase